MVRIINNTDFGGFYDLDFIEKNPDIVSEWVLIDVTNEQKAFIESCHKPMYNGSEFYEGLTQEEIDILNTPFVPEQLSRMKFIIQVFLSTGIKYEDIVIFITNLPNEVIDENSKYVVLTRLRGCAHFERNSSDLLMIAQMMEITTDQLDEIFINGNLIL